jgi:hypothetical protein
MTRLRGSGFSVETPWIGRSPISEWTTLEFKMLPSNSMIGAISEALALAETPNTLTKATAAAESAEITRLVILSEDLVVISLIFVPPRENTGCAFEYSQSPWI